MVVNISLADFILGGESGDICVDMSLDRFKELVGEPDMKSHKNKPLILVYGSTEVVFYHFKLFSIKFNIDKYDAKSESILIDDVDYFVHLTSIDVASFLKKNGLEFTVSRIHNAGIETILYSVPDRGLDIFLNTEKDKVSSALMRTLS